MTQPVVAILLAVLAGIGLMQGPARAQDLPLDAFMGTYRGTGAIRFDLDSPSRRNTVADKIVIGRVAGGFRLTQTLAYDFATDPANPVRQRRDLDLVFRRRADDPPRLYALDRGPRAEAADSDPLAGGETVWAVILGRTLLISRFRVLPDGRWVTGTSALTLDDGILEQHFQQQFAGQPPQFTTGSLQQDF